MKKRIIQEQDLLSFIKYLQEGERSRATVEKYARDTAAFFRALPEGKGVDKNAVIAYKLELTQHYKTASVNSMLVAVNGLLSFLGWSDCRVRLLKMQRQSFRANERELTRDEYMRLVHAAGRNKRERLSLVLQTICATGIRVSELRDITVRAVRDGRAEVRSKGKTRIIMIQKRLQHALLAYCARQKIKDGSVFITRGGLPLDRSNIWSEMKQLCKFAGVSGRKVFPHNLRHLFAFSYYEKEKDIVHLADLLGHSSVETTRIYTMSSGFEQEKKLLELGLVV